MYQGTVLSASHLLCSYSAGDPSYDTLKPRHAEPMLSLLNTYLGRMV